MNPVRLRRMDLGTVDTRAASVPGALGGRTIRALV
jgi:hypothetical protein